MKNEMLALILAGGQGTRLGKLTQSIAKPAVQFGGRYRIIDFGLSNCANSGINNVGVITQYQPLALNNHIGNGSSWGLDGVNSGVSILQPYSASEGNRWFEGTSHAIYQNIDYIDSINPEYVLILSGDHIYKMDYEVMLDYHKAKGADVTIACMPVPWAEASRFGVVIADDNGNIKDFEEKPPKPSSNLASMGIYIFNWPVLKEALLALKDQPGCDFGMHVIPYVHNNTHNCYAYEFNGYWKDVGTLGSYWQANMELIDIIPEFNLYEEFWKIYTNNDMIKPQYFGEHAVVDRCIIGEGAEIYGEVKNSVIGAGVIIEEGAVVHDSIVMQGAVIGAGTTVDKGIIAESVQVGKNCKLGVGEYAPNVYNPKVYAFDLVTISEKSVIPDGVQIGKNTAIVGKTVPEDYPDGLLASGQVIIKAGEM